MPVSPPQWGLSLQTPFNHIILAWIALVPGDQGRDVQVGLQVGGEKTRVEGVIE